MPFYNLAVRSFPIPTAGLSHGYAEVGRSLTERPSRRLKLGFSMRALEEVAVDDSKILGSETVRWMARRDLDHEREAVIACERQGEAWRVAKRMTP